MAFGKLVVFRVRMEQQLFYLAQRHHEYSILRRVARHAMFAWVGFLWFLLVTIISLFPGALSIKKSDPAKYNDIIKSHRCEKNFDKSSGTMEAAAVLNMFKRSVSKYGVYYTKYVGDGDSKTHNILTKNAPYTGNFS